MVIRSGDPASVSGETRGTSPPIARGTAPGSAGPATLISLLAAELSHDLAVPLTSIIANLELLEEELAKRPDPVADALLSRAARAAGRMHRMLDQRMELGTAPSRSDPGRG